MNRRSFLTLIPGGLAGMAVAKHLPTRSYDFALRDGDRLLAYGSWTNRSDVDYWVNRIQACGGVTNNVYWTQRMTATDQRWPPMSVDEVRNVFDRVKQ